MHVGAVACRMRTMIEVDVETIAQNAISKALDRDDRRELGIRALAIKIARDSALSMQRTEADRRSNLANHLKGQCNDSGQAAICLGSPVELSSGQLLSSVLALRARALPRPNVTKALLGNAADLYGKDFYKLGLCALLAFGFILGSGTADSATVIQAFGTEVLSKLIAAGRVVSDENGQLRAILCRLGSSAILEAVA